MKVATWNVNSLRARLDHLERWISLESPDVVLLQETKVTDEEFPIGDLARFGYEAVFHGQKSYNGVAILARHSIDSVHLGFNDADELDDRRLISARVGGIRFVSAYVVNGKSLDSPSYPEKLAFLEKLAGTIRGFLKAGESLVLGGDFNVCRDERDVFDVALMKDQLHFTDRERAGVEGILGEGLFDAFREFESGGNNYSWWDYRMGAFRRNRGLRIDYLFPSESLKPRLRRCIIDKSTRAWEKPSDHAPVVLELTDA